MTYVIGSPIRVMTISMPRAFDFVLMGETGRLKCRIWNRLHDFLQIFTVDHGL
ncbi:MAG: hypothetical protein NPIRA04_28360 [Nitrospirales bacterium]|nr:MAG: hypothetical protein NPIRA04_28360 [Nitrospirales bacterium]